MAQSRRGDGVARPRGRTSNTVCVAVSCWLKVLLLTVLVSARTPGVFGKCCLTTIWGQDSAPGSIDGVGTVARFTNPYGLLVASGSHDVWVTHEHALWKCIPSSQVRAPMISGSRGLCKRFYTVTRIRSRTRCPMLTYWHVPAALHETSGARRTGTN